jgi:hypothetical protein
MVPDVKLPLWQLSLTSSYFCFLSIMTIYFIGVIQISFSITTTTESILYATTNAAMMNNIKTFDDGTSVKVVNRHPFAIRHATEKLAISLLDSKKNSSSKPLHLWDLSGILPLWMKQYFSWHQDQRRRLRKENWNKFQFCVIRCLEMDSCGGTADRIKSIPLVLYWAAKTRRILMIHWSRPSSLESFLLPPIGGLDWRIPNWLVKHVVSGSYCGDVDSMAQCLEQARLQVSAIIKLQSHDGGSHYYNQHIPGPKFEEIYHDMWRIMFTPSLAIQQIIKHRLGYFHLSPRNYAAAHLRGLYGINNRSKTNAVKCALQLHPLGPIYFASDSKDATNYVIETMKVSHGVNVKALKRDYDPLHLEKTPNWRNHSISDFYDTFVDLYLLALARCLSYNVGGFGQWAVWISGHLNCSARHGNLRRLRIQCNSTTTDNIEKSLVMSDKPIFLSPVTA